jgi:hypothetical protein
MWPFNRRKKELKASCMTILAIQEFIKTLESMTKKYAPDSTIAVRCIVSSVIINNVHIKGNIMSLQLQPGQSATFVFTPVNAAGQSVAANFITNFQVALPDATLGTLTFDVTSLTGLFTSNGTTGGPETISGSFVNQAGTTVDISDTVTVSTEGGTTDNNAVGGSFQWSVQGGQAAS